MTQFKSRLVQSAFFVFFFLTTTLSTFAQTTTWTGSGVPNNDWSVAGNWDNGVPTAVGTAIIGISITGLTGITDTDVLRITGGTISLAAGQVFNLGQLEIQTGTLSLNNANITLEGNPTPLVKTGGTLNPGTSTITLGINTPRTISLNANQDFFNLVRLGSNASGGALTISGGTVNILNRLTLNTVGAGTFTGTITYGAGSSLSYLNCFDRTVGIEWPAASGPQNVAVSSAGQTITLVGNRTVTGDFTLQTGTVASAGFIVEVQGNITAALTAQATFSGAGRIDLTGSNAQNITGGSSPASISNLRINKTSPTNTVTLTTGSLIIGITIDVVQGILQVNGATAFDVSGATFRIQSNGTYRTGGIPISDNASTNFDFQSGSTFEYNGTTAETSPRATLYGNVIVNNPSTVTASGFVSEAVIANDLTFQNNAGRYLTSSASTIRVNGVVNRNGSSGDRFVDGPLRLRFNGTTSKTFQIGKGAGVFAPSTFSYVNTGATNNDIEMEFFVSLPGGFAPAGVSSIGSSYYTLRSVAGTQPVTPTYNVTLDASQTGFAPLTRARLLVQNASLGTSPSYASAVGSTVGTTLTATAVAAFPNNNFRLAFGAGGAIVKWTGLGGNSLWNNNTNWDSGVIPGPLDDVILDNVSPSPGTGYTVDLNTTSQQANSVTITPAVGQNITLVVDGNNRLSLNASTGAALDVNPGGTVRITGTTGSGTGINLNNLGGTATADFAANSTFDLQSGTGIDGGTVTYDIASTLQLSGTANINGPQGPFGFLTVTGGTPSISGASTVRNNISLTGGTLSPGDLSFTGSNVAVSGGNFSASPSSGTLIFSGSANQTTTGNISIGNVTMNKSSGEVTLGGSMLLAPSGAFTLTGGIMNTTLTNELVFQARSTGTTSVSDATNASFVRGPVRWVTKVFAAGLRYPIGDGNTARQMTYQINLADTTIDRSFTGETFNVNPSFLGYAPGPFTNISIVRYWQLTSSVPLPPITGTPQVTIAYSNADTPPDFIGTGVAALPNLRIAQKDAALNQWSNIGGSASGFPTGTLSGGTPNSAFSAPPPFPTNRVTHFTLASLTIDNPLPAEISEFGASPTATRVRLRWTTATERDNRGFIVERSETRDGVYSTVADFQNPTFNSLRGMGIGTFPTGRQYSVNDNGIVAGKTYYYRLKDMDMDGRINITLDEPFRVEVPFAYSLEQNYPNPFNPSTTIKFSLEKQGRTNVDVYNMMGQKVATIVSADLAQGTYTYSFNGSALASGMYFYRIVSGGFTETKKMLLVK
jgi:Secretion system C-terminal sorting domain